MNDQRPQVLAQKNFLEHRDRLLEMSLKDRFSYIFENNVWGSEESHSGLGSTLGETEVLRREISIIIRNIEAQSVLDIPCGDFQWMGDVDLGFASYTGADIVEAIVTRNREKFSSTSRQFLRLDLTADPLPRADLILCRDCLVHLSYANIACAIANVKRSGAKWLLTTHFLRLETNRDIVDGDWRPLNFMRSPFWFPPPHVAIVENCKEAGGAFDDKALGLWRVAELP